MRDLFHLAGAGVARVALPVPVDRLFDYAVPAELASRLAPGQRVRVKMSGRALTGVVVEMLAEDADEGQQERSLRPIERVLDEHPVLPESLVRVLIAEAEAVLCPVGQALAAAIPAGSAPEVVGGLALTPRGEAALASGAATADARAVLERLADGPVVRKSFLREAEAGDSVPGQAAAQVAALEREGLVRTQPFERGPRVRAARVRQARVAEGVDVDAAQQGVLARAPRQAELLATLAAEGPVPTAALARRSGGHASLLRALEARGLVVIEFVSTAHAPDEITDPPEAITLTPEQDVSCRAIGAAVREERDAIFLLHGVTGSGKTEVYMRAVADALAMGRQALVLVPEITLTHQLVTRLRARFGDRLAILHSGLRPGERLAQWERLRAGDTPIAVGARSALFAPIANLGVIVVDEEHDTAYKNEEGFRYHARRLAARRAREDRCPLVLGSATPALETRDAAERGAIERLRLEHRVGSRPLPAVKLVDLRAEKAHQPRGRKLILSGPLLRAMGRTLADRGQTILFLNRRGFSSQTACFDCQHVVRCKHCDISLTYHAARDRLCCHYCDHQEPPPAICPNCGSPNAMLLGIGTERVEEEVRMQFPDARIARLDRDVASRAGATRAVLDGLREGSLDIVIGTQMVAKGHDFPGVRLVGVVNADLGLHFPDFRAAERTFQLLTQVAGRAGRGDAPGLVCIQTFSPEHYAIAPVLTHDYETFYRQELGHRRALGYPPCGQLAQIRVSGEEEAAVKTTALRLAEAGRAGPGLPCEVLGPVPSPIARLRGRYRYQLLLKHRDIAVVRAAARRIRDASERVPSGVRASIDLQPVDMM